MHGKPVSLQIVHLDESDKLLGFDLAGLDVFGEDEALGNGVRGRNRGAVGKHPINEGRGNSSTNLLVLGEITGIHHRKSLCEDLQNERHVRRTKVGKYEEKKKYGERERVAAGDRIEYVDSVADDIKAIKSTSRVRKAVQASPDESRLCSGNASCEAKEAQKEPS